MSSKQWKTNQQWHKILQINDTFKKLNKTKLLTSELLENSHK